MKDVIVLKQTFNAAVERVWQALTDEKQMREWYFPDVTFKPEVGFTTQFNVHHEGKDFLHIWKVAEVIPLQKIAYEWRYGGMPGNSLLELTLTSHEEKTDLTLKHSRLKSFEPDQNPALSAENFEQGWRHFMEIGLKDYLNK
ncbi:MAG: SRPBCC domain-containing protein [Flavobacterium sp.]|nr:MAG: SRPBCC domain-containing protein [Flavobacterium sp.]